MGRAAMTLSIRKIQLLTLAFMTSSIQVMAAQPPVKLAAMEAKPDLRPTQPVTPSKPAVSVQPTTAANTQAMPQLCTPGAKEIAEILGILPEMEKMNALHLKGTTNERDEIDELKLHSKLSDSLLIAGLEVRDVAARIERELARLDRLHGALQDKRDKAIKYNSLANVFGTGVINEIGQAGEMKTNEIPGETTELVGGGIAMALSAYALHAQGSQKTTVNLKPNMLSQVLERPVSKDTQMPPVVWDYLNRVPPDATDGRTRLDELIRHWQKYRFIGNLKNSEGKNRATHLTNTGPRTTLSIDLMEDQMALLSDLRAEIYQIDRSLLELLLCMQKI
jgi:hypothetical protein